ncbi:MAG: DUF808 domain-containing protein [Proteobacteria bacterium]|nr:DUF808 domain-containing protein [Pseudomonadota bacterium]
MSTGLLALLDDVIALVKACAVSLDDIGLQVSKTSTKVSGIVIDDAAVTPKYVIGLDPSRELAIIWHIAKKSLINKLFILTPVILIFGLYLPWLIKPMLMFGGLFLCYEGYHKLHEIFLPHHNETQKLVEISTDELEKIRKDSAVRTDFILSAEIVAIAFATVFETNLLNQIIVLVAVNLIITIAVYGVVAIIVKLDDIGLDMAKSKSGFLKQTGILIVKMMPNALLVLSYVGIAAMLWVGSGIFVHNITMLEDFLHGLHLAWIFETLLQIVFALVLGWVSELCLGLFNY